MKFNFVLSFFLFIGVVGTGGLAWGEFFEPTNTRGRSISAQLYKGENNSVTNRGDLPKNSPQPAPGKDPKSSSNSLIKNCESNPDPKKYPRNPGLAFRKFSELKLIGESLDVILPGKNLSNNCSIVPNVYRDGDASSKCPGGHVFNPGNPQYFAKETDKPDEYGSLGTNNLGYYFCIQNVQVSKKLLCETRIAQLDANKSKLQTNGIDILVEWKGLGGSSNDGNCTCSLKQDGKATIVYDNCTDAAFNALNDKKTADDSKTEAKTVDETTNKSSEFAPLFDNCLKDLNAAIAKCDKTKVDALAKCNAENVDKNQKTDEYLEVAQGVGQTLLAIQTQRIQKDVNQNNSQKAGTCAAANLALTQGIAALGAFKNTCDDERKNCEKACGDFEKDQEKGKDYYEAACKKDIIAKNAVTPQEYEVNKDVNGKTYTNIFNERYDNAVKILSAEKVSCTSDIDTNEAKIDDVKATFDAANAQAQQCQCFQTVGSASVDCSSITNSAACLANPSLPDCALTLQACLPGSTGCPRTTNTGGPNGFAGVPTGGSALPPVGTVGPGSNSELGGGLNGLGEDENAPIAKTSEQGGNANPFGSAPNATGGSGGGGGGGPGSGAGAAPAGEPEGPKSGLGGFFSAAKQSIAAALGLGSKGNGGVGKASGGKSVDPNAFRPAVRGLAGGEGGGKSQSIWERMNNRYADNYSTFITWDLGPSAGPTTSKPGK